MYIKFIIYSQTIAIFFLNAKAQRKLSSMYIDDI